MTSAYVLSVGDWLKVQWVYTVTDSTQVVKLQTRWYWPDVVLISPAVCENLLSADTELSVTLVISAASPQPTYIGSINVR